MKELGLQELLRYALSGGVGIAALLLMYPNLLCLVGGIDSAGKVTLFLGAILLLGTLIYNIHRGLIFPLIFRVVGLIALYEKNESQKIDNPWKPSEREMEVDQWRWQLTKEAQRRWDDWGAQTHFLYCATWAIVLAFAVGWSNCGWPAGCRAGWLFLAILLFGAGLVNNYRLLYSMNSERAMENSKSARYCAE